MGTKQTVIVKLNDKNKQYIKDKMFNRIESVLDAWLDGLEINAVIDYDKLRIIKW